MYKIFIEIRDYCVKHGKQPSTIIMSEETLKELQDKSLYGNAITDFLDNAKINLSLREGIEGIVAE